MDYIVGLYCTFYLLGMFVQMIFKMMTTNHSWKCKPMPAPHIDLICKHTKVLPFEDALACHMALIECQSVNLSFMPRPPRKAASSPRPLPSLKRRVSSRCAQNGCRKSLRERRRSRFVALSALTQAGYPSQPQGSKRFGRTGTQPMNE